MLHEFFASALILLLASVLGVPYVLPSRRAVRGGLAPTVLLAPAAGFILMLLTTIVLVHMHAFTKMNLGLALGLVWIIGIALWRSTRVPDDAQQAGLPIWTITVLVIGIAAFLAATANTVYFIFQVSDFGEYVNSANELLAGEGFGSWFVNGFPTLLAVGGSIVGEALAVSVMPSIAVAFALGVAYIPWHFRMQPLVGILVFAIALAHPLVVWYGRFPASEAAYAMALVLSLGLWLLYVRLGYRLYLVAVALAGISMSLIRGNAVILAPMLLAVTFVVLASGTGAAAGRRRSANATIWLTGGVAFGMVYDIAMNRSYVVDYQFALFTPSTVGQILSDISTLQYALLMTGGLLLASLLLAVARRIGGSRQRRWIIWISAIGILMVSVIPIILGFLSGDVPLPYGHLPVIGSLLIAVSIGGAYVALRLPLRSVEVTHTGLLAWLLFAAFIAFQAIRLSTPHNVNAPWFLYWQRYYLSEVLPGALVLAAFFFGWLLDWFSARTEAKSFSRLVGQVAVVVLAVVIIASSFTGTIAAASTPMFEDARQELESVATAAEDTMDLAETDHIYWFAASDERIFTFWPNTHRPIALPLYETFEVSIFIGNAHVSTLVPTSPDEEPGCASLVELTSSGSAAIAIAASEALAPGDIHAGCDGHVDVQRTGTAIVSIERTGWDASVPANWQPVVVDTVVVSFFVVSADS